jgi:DNA-binding MurR/RpiR family transcriptional regulator
MERLFQLKRHRATVARPAFASQPCDMPPLAPPASFDALKARIASGEDAFPKRLAQAARHALAHPDEVALGTAASIAEAADVQPSTLVRLAHHLGYQGFSDFQSVFRERLRERASSYEERLARLEHGTEPESRETALLEGFLTAARRSVEHLAARVDSVQFAQAVRTLAAADTIYLVAKRRTYPLAAHLGYAFAKLGVRAVLIDSPNGVDGEIASHATAKDAAIACSFAPYAPETLELSRGLGKSKVPLVAITDSALSPLAALATHWLEVSESDFAGFRSLSASMGLTSALAVAVAERRRHRG